MAFAIYYPCRKRHPHLFVNDEDDSEMQRTNPSVSGPEPGINDDLIYGRLAKIPNICSNRISVH